MSSLVYTLCYGTSYLPLLAVWLRGLRSAGRYAGDVAVLTDLDAAHFRDEAFSGVRPLRSRAWRERSLYYEKTSLLDFGLLADYDVVLYLDADIAVTNPVAPILELCRRSDAVVLNRSRGTMDWTYNAGMLSAAELARVQQERTPGVNAGIFAGRRDALGRLLERWRDVVREHHRRSDEVPVAGDQPFLNRLVLRGDVPGFRFLPEGWVRDWTPESRLGWSEIRDYRAGRLKLVHLPGPHPVERKVAMLRQLGRRAARAKSWYGHLAPYLPERSETEATARPAEPCTRPSAASGSTAPPARPPNP